MVTQFWGVGATLGPIIMAQFISGQYAWRSGYLTIAVIQFVLAAILLFSIPLWKKVSQISHATKGENREDGRDEFLDENKKVKPLQIKGVKLALLSFLFYCATEATVGLWGSSYLVNVKGFTEATAAQWISFYWGGLTIGRFLTGFITFKMNNRRIIRMGQIIALVGAVLLVLPFPSIFSLIGFIIVGLGLAPIFPSMLHETPTRFGRAHSQKIMGYQMAVAYTGTTFMPPLLGYIASHTTLGIFPFFTLTYAAAMFLSSERLNKM